MPEKSDSSCQQSGWFVDSLSCQGSWQRSWQSSMTRGSKRKPGGILRAIAVFNGCHLYSMLVLISLEVTGLGWALEHLLQIAGWLQHLAFQDMSTAWCSAKVSCCLNAGRRFFCHSACTACTCAASTFCRSNLATQRSSLQMRVRQGERESRERGIGLGYSLQRHVY